MWKFPELTPGDLEHDPHEFEFFRLDPADSLVREVGQNSLDARAGEGQPVEIRFAFGSHPVMAGDTFFDPLVAHLAASKLKPTSFELGGQVSFLTVEDFGTVGLSGPIGQDATDDKTGNFFSFWWAEGRSQKGGHSGGRWGLGKTVYHLASQFRTFFGLTVRKDDGDSFLLGKALLKTHTYSSKRYKYYGVFAEDGYAPIADGKQLAEFTKRFALTRVKEPGLSLVIPLPVVELSAEKIARSAIIHYFFPVVRGDLRISVCDLGGKETLLSSETFWDVARGLDWTDTEWEGKSAPTIEALLTFLMEVVTKPGASLVELKQALGTHCLTEDLFGENLTQMRERYAAGEFLWMKVPIRIHRRGSGPLDSFFEVYIQKDDSLEQPDEFYIRSGIRVSEIKMLGRKRVRALLSAQDSTVSEFLGDCESPAHTDWKERTEAFREKYHDAQTTLRFVRGSMRELVKILDYQTSVVFKDLLKDVFSVGQVQVSPLVPPLLPPAPPTIELAQVKGGFKVKLTKGAATPKAVTALVAYDVHRGNPFKKYTLGDFDLAGSKLNIAVNDGVVVERHENMLKVQATGEAFQLGITGFDEKRDLRVHVTEEGA